MKTLSLTLAFLVCATGVATAGSICPAPNGVNPFPYTPDSAATGCNIIITVNADGSATISVTDTNSYINDTDVLIGVINKSGAPVSALTISGDASGTPAFALDGNGLCTWTFVGDSFCTPKQFSGTDPQDYYGPTSKYTMITANTIGGVVNFNPAIAIGGGTTYLSLESPPVTVIVGTVASDSFQIRYASDLDVGDSFVNFTNTGATAVKGVTQNLCVNLYTFDPEEELISCCTCLVTPDGLQTLSVVKSLISNPLTPAIPTSVVIKAVATSDPVCNAATAGTQAHGVLVWGTSLHQNSSTPVAGYSVTEGAFSFAALSNAELAHITSTCGFIQADGSKFGICGGCAAGGVGASSSVQ